MYTEKELVKIAKRDNNKKRNYLVVNPLQGKHIPVSPGKALGIFSELAGQLRIYRDERILVIGFSETATAIGARLAMEAGASYIQTTRESIPGAEYFLFSERHSHAVEQRLVKEDLDSVMDRTDRIVFAEDEVTTGNTIRNLMAVLEQNYKRKMKFAVASLLNGMSEEATEEFKGRGIGLHYLVKTEHDRYPEIADRAVDDGIYHQEDAAEAAYTACFDIAGWMDTRRLTDMAEYQNACQRLARETIRLLPLKDHEKILVLGTEECMYPGMYVGKCLEEMGHPVLFHATTRSPITVSQSPAYPLHERYALSSMYERDRKIFVYDIGSYDAVAVITDAQKGAQEGSRGELTLLNALRKKNEKVFLVRWCRQ